MNVVLTRIYAGLGNQLFQYAASLHYARARSATRIYAYRWTPYLGWPGINDVLSSPIPLASVRESVLGGHPPDGWPNLRREVVGRLRRAVRPAIPFHVIAQSADEAHEPGPEAPLGGRLLLDGYFQHRSVFEDHLAEICDEIIRGIPVLDLDQGRDRVAVSFRRADYVPRGWALDFDYYRGALREINPNRQKPLRIVSDDAEFAEAVALWFEADGYTVESTNATNRTPLGDLWTLATAENIVSSNSTFAWWAAAIGDRLFGDRHQVVIPRPWISDATDALRRPHWRAVPARVR